MSGVINTKLGLSQELSFLKSIDQSLKALLPKAPESGQSGSWTYWHVGKSWFYEQTVIYGGVAVSTDLILPTSVTVNRIEQIWGDGNGVPDGTAKDFSIRVFADASLSYYIELDTQTANTATSRVLQLGAEYKYPAGSRIRIYSGSNTAGKTDTIRIQVDEL